MINTSNAWPNIYVGVIWLIVFASFALFTYPHGKRGDRS